MSKIKKSQSTEKKEDVIIKNTSTIGIEACGPKIIYEYIETPEAVQKTKELYGAIFDQVLELRKNKKYENKQNSCYVFKSFYCKAGRRANYSNTN